MLSAHCLRHARTILVSSSEIQRIDNTEAGIVVHWRCTCGEPGQTRYPRRPRPQVL